MPGGRSDTDVIIFAVKALAETLGCRWRPAKPLRRSVRRRARSSMRHGV